MRNFTSWKNTVNEYLDHRKFFGNDLVRQSETLKLFAEYLDLDRYKGPLTSRLQVDWVKGQSGKTSYNKARKLNTLRQFSRYISLFDTRTQIPEKGFFGKTQAQFVPHLYVEEEILLIFETMKKLFIGKNHFSSHTYECAFKLILTCGLRASEVVNIFDEDIDFENSLIHIQKTKFKKSRLIPIDKTVIAALLKYRNLRNKQFDRCRSRVFFVTSHNCAITYTGLLNTFLRLKKRIGWTEPFTRRIHDFRHTFIVNRLLEWHREGIDSNTKIAALSVYVGHTDVAHTYHYFHSTPELMGLISERFKSYTCEKRSLYV